MQEGQKIGELPEEDQAKARLMVDLEKDVLLQWIGLIYLTLEEMGVQKVITPYTSARFQIRPSACLKTYEDGVAYLHLLSPLSGHQPPKIELLPTPEGQAAANCWTNRAQSVL